MNFWTELGHGCQVAFSSLNIIMVILGVILGSLIGAIRRLRAIHGVALFLPLTYAFSLPIEATMIFLLTVYYAAEFGRQHDIIFPSASAASEKQRSTMQTLAGIGSFVGGLIAICGMLVCIFLIKQVVFSFGPAEYFVLVLFAFASLSIRAGTYPLRTVISTLLGIMLASVGIDSTTGILRFTMGVTELYDGIEFTTVVVGLFVISKLFDIFAPLPAPEQAVLPQRTELQRLMRVSVSACRWVMLRSALLGFIIGILPGGGAVLASKLSQQLEEGFYSKNQDGFRARLKSIVAAETANSSAVGGAMVPLLALGIPGSGTAAIFLGALLLHNITPGPRLFNEHSDLIWGMGLSMSLANLLLVCLYWPLAKFLGRAREIPDWIFAPVLIALSFVGVYSVNGSSLSLLIMLILGVCAYILERWNYPLAPMLLGFVLGEVLENTLRRALAISGGDWHILFEGSICRILWLLTAIVLLLPWPIALLFRQQKRQQTGRQP